MRHSYLIEDVKKHRLDAAGDHKDLPRPPRNRDPGLDRELWRSEWRFTFVADVVEKGNHVGTTLLQRGER